MQSSDTGSTPVASTKTIHVEGVVPSTERHALRPVAHSVE